MTHLADCPICQKIVAGEVENETKDCCLVVLGSLKVAASKVHDSTVTSDMLASALDLLQHHVHGGLVSDYSGAPGHWAMHLLKMGELPQGKSEGRVS